MLSIRAPAVPPDFEDFWNRTRTQWREDRGGRVMSRDASGQRMEGYKIEVVRFMSLGGWELGGWLAVPADRPVTRGIVIGHGYAGRRGAEVEWTVPGAALFFPCVRGLALSRREGVSQVPQRHVLVGIESAGTSILRGCVADVWSAASALIECVPEAAERLDFAGASMAGGLGVMAMAFDERFSSGHIEIATFGHQRLRLRLPCIGSGHALTLYSREHPEVFETLSYLDPAVAAQFLKRPVQHACALFDPAVPPPGQFAVYNAHAGPKRLHKLTAGHWDYPEYADERERLNREIERFFAKPLAA